MVECGHVTRKKTSCKRQVKIGNRCTIHHSREVQSSPNAKASDTFNICSLDDDVLGVIFNYFVGSFNGTILSLVCKRFSGIVKKSKIYENTCAIYLFWRIYQKTDQKSLIPEMIEFESTNRLTSNLKRFFGITNSISVNYRNLIKKIGPPNTCSIANRFFFLFSYQGKQNCMGDVIRVINAHSKLLSEALKYRAKKIKPSMCKYIAKLESNTIANFTNFISNDYSNQLSQLVQNNLNTQNFIQNTLYDHLLIFFDNIPGMTTLFPKCALHNVLLQNLMCGRYESCKRLINIHTFDPYFLMKNYREYMNHNEYNIASIAVFWLYSQMKPWRDVIEECLLTSPLGTQLIKMLWCDYPKDIDFNCFYSVKQGYERIIQSQSD